MQRACVCARDARGMRRMQAGMRSVDTLVYTSIQITMHMSVRGVQAGMRLMKDTEPGLCGTAVSSGSTTGDAETGDRLGEPPATCISDQICRASARFSLQDKIYKHSCVSTNWLQEAPA